jgi:hypothetical protein
MEAGEEGGTNTTKYTLLKGKEIFWGEHKMREKVVGGGQRGLNIKQPTIVFFLRSHEISRHMIRQARIGIQC